MSLKASEIFMTVAAYRKIANEIEQPLHLGITEAGGLRSGTVKSAAGLGLLLMDGIGDTLRVSLAADPVEEVKVGLTCYGRFDFGHVVLTLLRARAARDRLLTLLDYESTRGTS